MTNAHSFHQRTVGSVIASATGLLLLGAPSVAVADAITIFSSEHYQHRARNEMAPGGAVTAKYTINSETEFPTARQKSTPQHSYPNPDLNWHRAEKPKPFTFVEHFQATGGAFLSQPVILAGANLSILTHTDPYDPYQLPYAIDFFKEGNAEFDKIDQWTGTINLLSGGIGSDFEFSLALRGANLFDVKWKNGTAAPKASVEFTGGIDKPTFTFKYQKGFNLAGGSIAIRGFASTIDGNRGFGRIGSVGPATLVEGVFDPQIVGVGFAPTYDVVSVPEPSVIVLTMLGSFCLSEPVVRGQSAPAVPAASGRTMRCARREALKAAWQSSLTPV